VSASGILCHEKGKKGSATTTSSSSPSSSSPSSSSPSNHQQIKETRQKLLTSLNPNIPDRIDIPNILGDLNGLVDSITLATYKEYKRKLSFVNSLVSKISRLKYMKEWNKRCKLRRYNKLKNKKFSQFNL
jgi:hypothetical protein